MLYVIDNEQARTTRSFAPGGARVGFQSVNKVSGPIEPYRAVPLFADSNKWLFFANRGGFRDGDINEIMNKTSCLSLLSNAVVIWNTIHMQKIVDRLRAAGEAVKEEDLARNWPLLHAHIIPNGMYDFPGC